MFGLTIDGKRACCSHTTCYKFAGSPGALLLIVQMMMRLRLCRCCNTLLLTLSARNGLVHANCPFLAMDQQLCPWPQLDAVSL